MATREQLHKEIDALGEDQLERAHLVIEPNGASDANGAELKFGFPGTAEERAESIRVLAEEHAETLRRLGE